MVRYVVYGAGGVGCLIGGQLRLAGHDIALIARGEHGKAMAERGLRLKSPTGEHLLNVPVVGTLAELSLDPGDTVVLAMKTQDVPEALERIAAQAPVGVAVVCAQNGVASEQLALRMFEHVYGALVIVYAAITEPGTVSFYSSNCAGIIDVGRYPEGVDDRAADIVADLVAAGFQSLARPDIMRWKRGKLLISLGNVAGALCPADDQPADLLGRAREEAESCFRAAGLDYLPLAELAEGPLKSLTPALVDGAPFPGSSTFQGLVRGSATSEADYFNGEIALLGRMLGVPTPVNAFLQQFMREALRREIDPGSLSAASVREAFAGWPARATEPA